MGWRNLLIGELSWMRLGRSLLILYVLLALYAYFRADSMIFLPRPSSYEDTEEILKLPVTDQEQISALYLPNDQATYTLLYSHGNAEDLGDVYPVLERFYTWGFSVLAYDYRGYGTSDGYPSERNAYQDIEAAYRYLTESLEIPPQQIILYGRSVGSGPSVALATRYPVGGLALESAFTSVFQVALPFPLFPFDKFPNLRRLPQVDCPVLILHGQADTVIPFHHGQRLYDAAPEPKLSLWVAEAGHNDFTWVAGDRHRQILEQFQALLEAEQASASAPEVGAEPREE